MAIEVFNRYEKKYMLDEHTFRRLLERINDYMEPDKYNLNGQFYSICNIYYDTDDNRLIRSSIEKPVYKEKLRMRSYGTPCGEDKVFLEIKKKYNGIVNKRRTSIVLKDAYKYMESDVYPESDIQCINTQVLKEIDYFKKMYTLKPKVYLSYDRYAYFEKNDIMLNIKYGWNEARIESLLNSVDNKQYELICFASYIYLERQPSNSICDDYKNFEKSILIEEIDKEVFLSDYYKANLGESNFFNSKPPIFSKENEGIKLKLTPEYINWIEESTENYSKKFYFAVVPIYYDSINNKYLLDFGSKYDGIEIKYHYDEEKKLVYMYAR